MSESPDWGESPSVDNSSKYTPARRTPAPNYSSSESPTGESPSDNWARPAPAPAKIIYVPTPAEPPKKNKRYKL